MPNDDGEPPKPLEEFAYRCRHCGYNARGAESFPCPECGGELEVLLGVFTQQSLLNTVADALGDVGISYEIAELKPTYEVFSTLFGRPAEFGTATIHVPRADIDRAREVLRAVEESPPKPIVARADPVCPQCEAHLDLGKDVCSGCGCAFQWVSDELIAEEKEDAAPVSETPPRRRSSLILVVLGAVTFLAGTIFLLANPVANLTFGVLLMLIGVLVIRGGLRSGRPSSG